MKSEKIFFRNRQGNRLSAFLDLPDDKLPNSYAIFAHCFTCTKQFKLIVNINRELTKNNIGVFRFDFTGLGESGGDFANTSFTTNVNDLLDASDYLKENYQAPNVLIGHSLGGLAAIKASSYLPSIKAVSTIGAPYNLSNLASLISKYKKNSKANDEFIINVGGRDLRVKEDFLRDIKKQDIPNDIRSLSKPILVFHAIKDEIVRLEDGEQIFQNSPHPKSFMSLKNADHLISDNNDSRYVGGLLSQWLKEYI